MRRLLIVSGLVAIIIGFVLFGGFGCSNIELDNGMWWSGLVLIAGLLLVLDWFTNGEDDD